MDRRALLMTLVLCFCVLSFVQTRVSAESFWDTTWRWPYGPIETIAAVGDRAFVGSGTVFLSIDCTTPWDPQVTGELVLDQNIRGIVVEGETAFLAADRLGLVVIDVSDPTSPTVVSSLSIPWNVTAIAKMGTTVYLGDGGGYLRLIDVADIECPEEIASVVGQFSFDATSVFVSDTQAFTTDRYFLHVFDISDPYDPRHEGSLQTGDARDVVVDGSIAYLAGGYDGLKVVNVDNPTNPELIGQLDTGGLSCAIAHNGSLVFLADGSEGLRVIDVSVPSAPLDVTAHVNTGEAWALAFSGPIALVVNRLAGFSLIDMSSPGSPWVYGVFDNPSALNDFAIYGGFLYLAESAFTLRIVDRSAPSRLGVGSCTAWSGVGDIAVSEDHVFGLDLYTGLVVFDVSDPTNPQQIGSCATPGSASHLEVSNGLVYVADAESGLRVIDVTQPTDPVEIGSFTDVSYICDLEVNGDIVLLADRVDGLRMIDVSFPGSPVQIGFLEVDGGVDTIDVVGDRAFFAGGFMTSGIVDISDPTHPVMIGQVNNWSLQLRSTGSHMYIPTASESVRIYDVTRPQEPTYLSAVETPSAIRRMKLDGSIPYVGFVDAGVSAFMDLSDCIFVDNFELESTVLWTSTTSGR